MKSSEEQIAFWRHQERVRFWGRLKVTSGSLTFALFSSALALRFADPVANRQPIIVLFLCFFGTELLTVAFKAQQVFVAQQRSDPKKYWKKVILRVLAASSIALIVVFVVNLIR